MDPYDFLKVKLNPDGSLTRHYVAPTLSPSPTPTPSSDPHAPPQVTLSKELPLNAAAKTSLRLFVHNHPPPLPSSAAKLPVVFYFHGGGFVLFSSSTVSFHRACESLAAAIPAVVVSVEYRLSPEHRLPAAYDDAVEALQWVRSQALDPNRSEPWMRDYADFGKYFVMGNSCGGNIACFAGLRALDLDLSPLTILGIVMNVPFFGGVQRSESEIRSSNDPILPLPASDLVWALSLPEGADRDHVYCNPTVMDRSYGEKIGRLRRCFVNGFDGDPLVDRGRELVKILESRGVHVQAHFSEGGYHAVELFDDDKAQVLYDNVKKFILSSIAAE